MNLADGLADWLSGQPVWGGAEVVGWRFELAEEERLHAGLRGGRLGGPYHPPGISTLVSGELDLRWSDGLRTLATLDRRVASERETALAAWRAEAFRDQSAPPIPGPCACPTVDTADPRVEQIVRDDRRPFLELLGRARAAGRREGCAELDATAVLGRSGRTIVSSRGLAVCFPETTCSLTVAVGDLYEAEFAKRRLPREDELAELVDRTTRTATALRREEQLPPGSLSVLLLPEVVEAMARHFLGGNLAGRAVLDGRSAFSLKAFRDGQLVARQDLEVIVDTTLPLELATTPCSAEGVPGGRVALIAGGRLVTPTLGMAQAQRCGLPPTPTPRGAPALLFRVTGSEIELDEACARLDRGLIVSFVMGLHTQPARTGSYAVAAPQAQLVRNGAAGGRVRVRLAGNLFDHLRDRSAAFVRVPRALNPGLLLAETLAVRAS